MNSTFTSPDKTPQPKKASTTKKNPKNSTQKIAHLISAQQRSSLAFIQLNENTPPSVAREAASTPSIQVNTTPVNSQASIAIQLQNLRQTFQGIPSFRMASNLGQVITIPAQPTIQPQFQQQQLQQQGLIIPNGFQGTILFQPTIHMHSKNSSVLDLNKYRQIIPKKKPT